MGQLCVPMFIFGIFNSLCKKKKKLNKQLLIKKFRLDKFIDLALYQRNGYYLSKKPIGKKFDFVASPEISQMFGKFWCVFTIIGKKKLFEI